MSYLHNKFFRDSNVIQKESNKQVEETDKTNKEEF